MRSMHQIAIFRKFMNFADYKMDAIRYQHTFYARNKDGLVTFGYNIGLKFCRPLASESLTIPMEEFKKAVACTYLFKGCLPDTEYLEGKVVPFLKREGLSAKIV